MPLPKPFAYIVNYELKQPAASYEPLFKELKNSYKWFHYINSTWIVCRYDSLYELGPKLRRLIFQGDWLLITPAKGPADGWLPKDAWTWINENVPKEW